jgi:hypothetical protein
MQAMVTVIQSIPRIFGAYLTGSTGPNQKPPFKIVEPNLLASKFGNHLVQDHPIILRSVEEVFHDIR